MYGWNIGTCFENAIALLVTVLAMRGGLTLAVVVLVASLALGRWSKKEELNRKSFPQGFIFGTASSAYQVLLFSYLISSFLRILRIFEWLGNMGTDHS